MHEGIADEVQQEADKHLQECVGKHRKTRLGVSVFGNARAATGRRDERDNFFA